MRDPGSWMYEIEPSRRGHFATVTENRVVEHPAVSLLGVCLGPLYLSVLVELPVRHEEQRIPKQDHWDPLFPIAERGEVECGLRDGS